MKTAKFVVFQGKDKWWYWHLVSANGRVIAQGEGHTRKADAERAIATVKKTVRNLMGPTTINIVTGAPKMTRKQLDELVARAPPPPAPPPTRKVRMYW